MFVDSTLTFGIDAATRARHLESEGFDALWASEDGHDPFATVLSAIPGTHNSTLGTNIAVAFARSPMVTATLANDAQMLSQGRFILGLGSQIKPHIEKRYSMPWSHPAARMREYIQALRAIWSCWNEGEKLFFRGEFYRHTLMTPFFSPRPHEFGPPPIYLAAVGELMTEVAGEVADGLFVHPFTTEQYLREVTLPALDRGLAKSGRKRSDVQISLTCMVVTGSEDEQRTLVSDVRKQLAFYGSTPAYSRILELGGWGDLQPKLNELSRNGGWDEMAGLISDDVLHAFSVVADETDVVPEIARRFGDVVSRLSFYPFGDTNESHVKQLMSDIRAV